MARGPTTDNTGWSRVEKLSEKVFRGADPVGCEPKGIAERPRQRAAGLRWVRPLRQEEVQTPRILTVLRDAGPETRSPASLEESYGNSFCIPSGHVLLRVAVDPKAVPELPFQLVGVLPFRTAHRCMKVCLKSYVRSGKSLCEAPLTSERLPYEGTRGLTLLLHRYVNPCGRYELDTSKRLPLPDITHTTKRVSRCVRAIVALSLVR